MTDRRLELYCVRHAETDWNADGRIQGCEDTQLSAAGREQAASLAERLRSERYSACYTSDLRRAIDTADALNAHLHLDIQHDRRLRERHFGVFQGQRLETIARDMPDLHKQYESRNPDFAMPEGQSWQQKFEQISAFMDEMLDRHAGQRLLVVTHGGCLLCMAHAVLGIPLERRVPMHAGNTGICVFVYETGRWILRRWGDQQHLGPRAG